MRIFTAGTTQTITLTGAPHTITVEEDDDEDMFLPVRTESGYIRIIDTGTDVNGQTFDWHSLIPTSAVSNYVELWNIDDGEVVWRGFMKPQTFQGDLNIYPQERSFPIVGVLNVLESYDFTVTETEPFNLACVLYKIFHDLAPYNVYSNLSYFAFQGIDVVGGYGIESDGWLYQRLPQMAFYELDDDGNRKAKYNCFEVLENFCKFFGYTCRSGADSVWFCAPSQVIAGAGFTSITLDDMAHVADGQSVQYGNLQFNTYTFPESFVDMENTEIVVQGISKANVAQDVGLVDDNILELDTDGMTNVLNETPGVTFYSNNYGDYGKHFFVPTAPGSVRMETAQDTYIDRYTYNDLVIDIPLYGDPQSSLYSNAKLRFDDWTDDIRQKLEFEWTPSFRLLFTEWPWAYPAIIIRNKTIRLYSDGIFCITGKSRIDVSQNGHAIYNGAGEALLSFRVGNKYYDPNVQRFRATQTPITFVMKIGGFQSANGEGQIPNTREFDPSSSTVIDNNPYPPYKGCGVPTGSSVLFGEVEIAIYAFNLINASSIFPDNNYFVDFTSFDVKFVRSRAAGEFTDKDTNEYTYTTGLNFNNDKKVETIFSTDAKNGFGNNILINASGRYTQNLSYTGEYGGSYEIPGQQLADEIGSYYSRPRRIIETNQRMSMFYAALIMQRKYAYNGKTYYPLSIKRDWQDDVLTIKMIDL